MILHRVRTMAHVTILVQNIDVDADQVSRVAIALEDVSPCLTIAIQSESFLTFSGLLTCDPGLA